MGKYRREKKKEEIKKGNRKRRVSIELDSDGWWSKKGERQLWS